MTLQIVQHAVRAAESGDTKGVYEKNPQARTLQGQRTTNGQELG